MSLAFAPMSVVTLPVQGTDLQFPVRRVYCVGRNYAAHAREMGFDPDREPPFFFCKPNDPESIVPVAASQTMTLPYPAGTENFHYEIELVVAIGRRGSSIPVEEASSYIYGYAVGLDMTRRDLQMKMREQGRPWEIGKAFDFSAPVGPIRPIEDTGALKMHLFRCASMGKLGSRATSPTSSGLWTKSSPIFPRSSLWNPAT